MANDQESAPDFGVDVTHEVRIQVAVRARSDRSILRDLRDWMLASQIFPTFTPYSGLRGLIAYFRPDDAEKVRAWLDQQS